MCFHNSMSAKAKKLAARYNLKTDIVEIYKEILEENYHVNAFTHPLYPIVTGDSELQAFHWGLVPFWVKSEEQAKEIENMTINAKADTVFEKPSFRHSIMSKRCVVPSTGFFEWRHEGKDKVPYFIQVINEEIFSMAGIFDVWNNPQTGEIYHSFSIITSEANSLMEYIHNTKKRMPVILSPEDEQRWIDPNLNKEGIKELLKPFDADKMNAYIINKDFLKKNPKDKSIIEAA